MPLHRGRAAGTTRRSGAPRRTLRPRGHRVTRPQGEGPRVTSRARATGQRDGRSAPRVVPSPCPAARACRRRAAVEQPGLTSASREANRSGSCQVLPTPPGNSESPVSASVGCGAAPGTTSATDPGVWPAQVHDGHDELAHLDDVAVVEQAVRGTGRSSASARPTRRAPPWRPAPRAGPGGGPSARAWSPRRRPAPCGPAGGLRPPRQQGQHGRRVVRGVDEQLGPGRGAGEDVGRRCPARSPRPCSAGPGPGRRARPRRRARRAARAAGVAGGQHVGHGLTSPLVCAPRARGRWPRPPGRGRGG